MLDVLSRKISGEARRCNPYSKIGEIMRYKVNSFVFIYGYVSRNWGVMSEQNVLADKKLSVRLYEAKYQAWKRRNVTELHCEYGKIYYRSCVSFESFGRERFNRI